MNNEEKIVTEEIAETNLAPEDLQKVLSTSLEGTDFIAGPSMTFDQFKQWIEEMQHEC